MQVQQSNDYVAGRTDDRSTDEDLDNFLDDYYPEVDAEEVKENFEIQNNDYRELVAPGSVRTMEASPFLEASLPQVR